MVEAILIAALIALIIGRLVWEKRTGQPEYHDDAVGGWFGGVPEDAPATRSRRDA